MFNNNSNKINKQRTYEGFQGCLLLEMQQTLAFTISCRRKGKSPINIYLSTLEGHRDNCSGVCPWQCGNFNNVASISRFSLVSSFKTYKVEPFWNNCVIKGFVSKTTIYKK